MKKYLSILLRVDHYHFHIRRQAAEGINLLLKGSDVNKKLLKSGKNYMDNLYVHHLKISGYILYCHIH